jgi:hypothetical protein
MFNQSIKIMTNMLTATNASTASGKGFPDLERECMALIDDISNHRVHGSKHPGYAEILGRYEDKHQYARELRN